MKNAVPPQDPRYKVAAYHDTDDDVPDRGVAYLNCHRCLEEWKAGAADAVGTSPQEYARQQVALTQDGLQVWCTRHDMNITAIALRAVPARKPAGLKAAGGKP